MQANDERLNRSYNYRTIFFMDTKPDKYTRFGTPLYHCAYCGKPLFSEELQVDHIVSVRHAKVKKSARDFMFYHGIRNINSPKNLAASCPRCNLMKGSKGGLWIYRGLIGKHYNFWRVIRSAEAILVGSFLYLMYKTGYLSWNILINFWKGPFF